MSIKNVVSFSCFVLTRQTETEYVKVPVFLFLAKKIKSEEVATFAPENILSLGNKSHFFMIFPIIFIIIIDAIIIVCSRDLKSK